MTKTNGGPRLDVKGGQECAQTERIVLMRQRLSRREWQLELSAARTWRCGGLCAASALCCFLRSKPHDGAHWIVAHIRAVQFSRLCLRQAIIGNRHR